ncbi:MAG: erythromycin esterase family protein [Actinomycetota bacterium]|nr:erythromycin esterase family protein [Actinomycetota bacterium]
MADVDAMRALAQPLVTPADLDPLLERIGDAHYVLLGEASHGTAEYYSWRAEITRRLVAEQGFSFVAVEGAWPDCYRVNRCVKHGGEVPADPREVLDGYERWPTWMWANEEVVDFARWLREHNAGRSYGEMVGFYGLDVYSLWDSIRALTDYLQAHDPEHVEAARAALRCFEPYREDPQGYAWATHASPCSCQEAAATLTQRLSADGQRPDGQRPDGEDPEARFAAEQNAAVVAGAERYYRTMVEGRAESWNVRDRHMTDTLDRLMARHGEAARAVVWEHNTHLGDARYTDMAAGGMVNVGQLVRERHGERDVVIVGFGGHRGRVIAARSWGAQMQRMPVPPAREGSIEARLHSAGLDSALFVFPPRDQQPAWLREELDHRAIGVVYAPHRERRGNYVPTVLGSRYDAFLYVGVTDALHPLHLEPEAASGEAQTYPSAV